MFPTDSLINLAIDKILDFIAARALVFRSGLVAAEEFYDSGAESSFELKVFFVKDCASSLSLSSTKGLSSNPFLFSST